MKVRFSQSRKISLIKEFFHSQENFPQSKKFPQKIWSKKFSTKNLIKEIFQSQGTFPKNNWSSKFSTVKEIFHKKLDQGSFSQSRKFSTKNLIKMISYSPGNFPQRSFSWKIWSKKLSLDQKRLPKAKIFCKQKNKKFL